MSAHTVGRSRAWLFLLGIVGLGLSPLGVFGQQDDGQLGNVAIEERFRAPALYKERRDLISGDRSPKPADKDLMDLMSKFYFWRVTWESPRRDPGPMAKILTDFESDFVIHALPVFTNKGGNKEFITQFGPHVAARFKEIFAKDFEKFRVSQINAGVMLVSMCRFKQEEVGDLLVELLKDKKQHDVIKLYALKGMREFFPIRVVPELDELSKQNARKKERDLERIQVLMDFIGQRFPTPASWEELEASRYIRREAIASLAHVGAPAVAALKKKGVVEGPAAYGLIKVLLQGREGLPPLTITVDGKVREEGPSLMEKVEAALGLCRLKKAEELGYDPSVGVYLVARTLVDFFSAYNKDFVNIAGAKTVAKVPFVAWRLQAERFKEGLKELVANTKDYKEAHANARELEKTCLPLFADMQGKQFNQLQGYNVFLQIVPRMMPKSGVLYTRAKGPQVELDSLQAPAPMDN